MNADWRGRTGLNCDDHHHLRHVEEVDRTNVEDRRRTTPVLDLLLEDLRDLCGTLLVDAVEPFAARPVHFSGDAD
jgi:hypothetical protein